MSKPLFPHQQTGATRIANRVPTYLALDMGIGKTRTFIEAVLVRRAKRVLVICPASALLVWKREIALWAPGATFVIVRAQADLVRPAHFFIISHGLMSQTHGVIAEAVATGPAFEMTAVDEAHAFNAADTNRVKALRRAAPKLGQIVPLSGTPMRNHAGDLYTLLSICAPQWLDGATGPRPGARFRGTNQRGKRRWKSVATVVDGGRTHRESRRLRRLLRSKHY
jgi:superfamily II DNA or RNA helicase